MESNQKTEKRRARMWPAAVWLPLVAIVALIVYKDLPKTPFFLDDYLHMLLIERLGNPLEPFITDVFMGAFFRPAITVFWALDYAIYGHDAGGFYVSNLIYLLASVALLYALLHNLTGSHATAGLGSLFFAVGPVTGVGVEWLSNRFDLIGTMFFLGATLLFVRYVRFRARGDYALALVFATVAFFCKEVTITMPVVMVMAASFMFLYRAPRVFDARLVKRIISYSTPFFTIAAIFLVWRFVILGSMGGYTGEESEPFSLGYFFFLWRSFGEYVWLAKSPLVFVVLLLIVGAFIAKTDFYAANKLFFFGVFFMLITSAPLAMVLQKRAVMAYMTPRFFFLPNIGVLIALISIYDPRGGRLRRVLAAVFLGLLVAAMGLNNYILVHKWYRDRTKNVDHMEQLYVAMEKADNAPAQGLVYTCMPGLDVALDTAMKFHHRQYLDRFYFLNCQGPTQTIATRGLYSAQRRMLDFPQTFSRNPCTYDGVVYGVVDTKPREVIDRIRSVDSTMVLDLDRHGEVIALGREKIKEMLKVRFGIDFDGGPPNV